MTTLWHLSPNVPKHSERLWHYGSGNFKYQVPGINCPNCGPGGGGNAKLHSIECPSMIRKEIEALQGDSPCLTPSQFARAKRRWEAGLHFSNYDQEIDPGDSFPPFLWRIPTIPRYNIYWLFFATILAEALASRLLDKRVTGIALLRVSPLRVGAFEVEDKIPEALFNQCNEPEDIMELVPALSQSEDLGQFFYLFASGSSLELWKRENVANVTVCGVCKRMAIPKQIEIERSKARSRYRGRKEIPLQYCFASDIFHSHIYEDGFIISPRVLDLLNEADLRNCKVSKLKVV